MDDVEVEVRGVGTEADDDEPVLLLQERANQRRCLPVWIGGPEALAVAAAMPGHEGPAPPRPLTHQLLLDVLDALDTPLRRGRLTAVVADQFHAELELDPTPPRAAPIVVSARASDAVVLALQRGCPILVAGDVLDLAGLPIHRLTIHEGPDTPTAVAPEISVAEAPDASVIDDQVERLREALSDATPEDFEPGNPSTGNGDAPPDC